MTQRWQRRFYPLTKPFGGIKDPGRVVRAALQTVIDDVLSLRQQLDHAQRSMSALTRQRLSGSCLLFSCRFGNPENVKQALGWQIQRFRHAFEQLTIDTTPLELNKFERCRRHQVSGQLLNRSARQDCSHYVLLRWNAQT